MSASDETGDGGKGGCAAGCIVIAALLFPPYVLSVGPFVWLVNHGYLPQAAGIIYAPFALFVWYEPARKLLAWYIQQWQ